MSAITVLIRARTGLVCSNTAQYGWEAVVQWHEGKDAHMRRILGTDKADAETKAQAFEKQLREDWKDIL